jgi:hypothetical protein
LSDGSGATNDLDFTSLDLTIATGPATSSIPGGGIGTNTVEATGKETSCGLIN